MTIRQTARESIGILLIIALVAVLLIGWSGCSLPTNQGSTIEQEQRETVTGSATTDIANRTISTPTPTKIEVPGADGGAPTKIEIPPTVHSDVVASATANETSNSSARGSASAYQSVPFLIAAGFGLLALAAAAWLLYLLFRKSKALTAAWTIADEFMTSGINTVRTMAMSETDPKAAGVLSAVVSALEGKRADFNAD